MGTKKRAKRTGTPAARVETISVMNLHAPREHQLKSWPQNFAAVRHGIKPFEIRYNDRNFKVGDRLRLCEFIPLGDGQGHYTGNEVRVDVTYVSVPLGLRDGYVALTTQPAPATPAIKA